MKKISAFTVILAVVLAVLAPCSAFAQTTAEQEIRQAVLTDKRVEKCSCLVFERNCLVAIKSSFAGKTERDEFVRDLENKIKSNWQIDKVFVVGSPKVMQAIDSVNKLPESERQNLVRRIFEQYGK